jgi:heat shock protein HslJ
MWASPIIIESIINDGKRNYTTQMIKNTNLRNQLIRVAILVLLAVSSSCTSILYVAPRKADCTGVSAQTCYLIRSSAEGNWVMHYQEIKGFDFEPGFSYKIKVKKESVKNSPADGSSLRYSMVELLEKKDVTEDIVMEDLVGKDWELEFLKSDGTQFGFEDKAPMLTFSEDGKVTGFAGCNNFFGSYDLTARTVKITGIGATKMHCNDAMDLETAYLKVLSLELRALFSEGKLILSADGSSQMILGYK